MASLKILPDKDPKTGELRVPPECMRLLLAMSNHRDGCNHCLKTKTPQGWVTEPCLNYQLLMDQLLQQPEVSIIE